MVSAQTGGRSIGEIHRPRCTRVGQFAGYTSHNAMGNNETTLSSEVPSGVIKHGGQWKIDHV